ncbi:MAG: hypothetical protein A3F68_06270 [Acidobacteria bacterium RIFCSPLOWO2_12_FULL_54_10]|nr:MAG: hypothetical protein A3F68_06270 [Acidobacteria bacterium RIFCSPLOWO2_12_FULL_54_10]
MSGLLSLDQHSILTPVYGQISAREALIEHVPFEIYDKKEAVGAGFFGGGEQGGGEFLVEGKEVLDALAVVVEGLRAVATVHGAVEGGVGFDQRGRHRQRVVKVGQRRLGKFLARVQHRLRDGFHGSALFGARLVWFLSGPHRHL